MAANISAELKNILERKLKLASILIEDYIYDEKILDRWVNVFALHDSLSKELEGPQIQKQLSKIKGVLVWQPDTETSTYSLYDLFLFFVPPDKLEPAEVQFLFAYFYPIKLVRNFINRRVTEDIYSGLALFTKEYEIILDYVEQTATVFYDWSQKENENIIKFFEEKIPELEIADIYIVELLKRFNEFENVAKNSSIQQWNYMQSRIFEGESVLDVIKEAPNFKEIYDIYNRISEDPTSFPEQYFSMKKLSKSPQMLFDLQEDASITKQYFIDEYNKVQLSDTEKILSYFQEKLKLLQSDKYTTKLAANVQKIVYQLKLLKLPKYYEDIYNDLQIAQADFIEEILEIDKDTKAAYEEMIDSLEFLPKKLKDTAFMLSASNLFGALNVVVDPILFEDNNEILDFFERIKTNASILYSLKDEIKDLPSLPAPQWPDFELKESLLWLAREHPQAFIETDKPSYMSHAFYHAAVDYQRSFTELLYAHDALTYLKQTFNTDWFMLRLQIIDYLRFFAKLDDHDILPEELKFVDFEALEDLLGQAYTPESIKQLQKYIMAQYAWVTNWVKELNTDILESLGILYNLLSTITTLPPLGANFEDNLQKTEAWLKTVDFKSLTNKIEMYLAKLGELLREAAAYQEALYDFVFTRNFHMVFDYYIDDFYDIFEQIPDLSWKAVVGQLSFENLIAYMKQNEILFVLGLKQLQASLIDVFEKRASTLVDALDVLECGAFKQTWPLIASKIHYNLGIEVNSLYILPFSFEYGVV